MSISTKQNVPFLDIKAQNRSIWPEIQAAIDSVTTQAQFILGPAVERFEKAFAEYTDRKYCSGLNNGTSALHMALQACDIGPGDEVITTPHTWVSTSWAISYVGATPVYVDIDPVTYNINPALIERAITPRTKVILPVHLYGQTCDMDALCEIAQNRKLLLIEDAAQAHGAMYNGRKIGSFGHLACFSFYPGKNLGAFGEGGAVVTDDEKLNDRIRRLRDHAQSGRHNHVELGHNTRMEGIQGAVLDVKLHHLDNWNSARNRHAKRYLDLLADVPGIQLPAAPKYGRHVWHLFVVLVEGIDRDILQKQLAERGISTGVHYPTPVPMQPAYAHLGYKQGDFPVAEDVMHRCLSLPMFAELEDEQIDYVSEVMHELAESHYPVAMS
jgi:dTDP-4-amino-4,6-dideoxygalactose transaminase